MPDTKTFDYWVNGEVLPSGGARATTTLDYWINGEVVSVIVTGVAGGGASSTGGLFLLLGVG
jgi:hypothetical protein